MHIRTTVTFCQNLVAFDLLGVVRILNMSGINSILCLSFWYVILYFQLTQFLNAPEWRMSLLFVIYLRSSHVCIVYLQIYFVISISSLLFKKMLAKFRCGDFVEMLAVESVHRISSSMMHVYNTSYNRDTRDTVTTLNASTQLSC